MRAPLGASPKQVFITFIAKIIDIFTPYKSITYKLKKILSELFTKGILTITSRLKKYTRFVSKSQEKFSKR